MVVHRRSEGEHLDGQPHRAQQRAAEAEAHLELLRRERRHWRVVLEREALLPLQMRREQPARARQREQRRTIGPAQLQTHGQRVGRHAAARRGQGIAHTSALEQRGQVAQLEARKTHLQRRTKVNT
eukprot:6203375-Pleurochrysis_carterae.AAC.3